MMNPIETIWSKVKMHVKRNISLPPTNGTGICEQRIQYLMASVESAKSTVSAIDCARAVQHSTTFYGSCIALEDMSVGI